MAVRKQPQCRKRADLTDLVFVDVKQSITELRRIYSNLSNSQFASWYSKRYGVPQKAIIKFLEREE